MGVVVASLRMTGCVSRCFWWAWLLSALAVWAMDVNVINLGRSADFSILFFTLELVLIFSAQKTRNLNYLYWLPLLFLVWANFHIQFVYGLVLPWLFAAVKSVEHLVTRQGPTEQDCADDAQALRPVVFWAIFAACLAPTLVTPYTAAFYPRIFDLTQ